MNFLSMHTDSQRLLESYHVSSSRRMCARLSLCRCKKNMTNLEHYVIGAEEFLDDIKLIMVDDEWRNTWWKSKHETLKDWLVAEYKPYKLSQFEHDLLLAVKEWSGGEHTVEHFCILRDLKEKGYFKSVDTKKSVCMVIEQSEVISDD